MQTRTVQKPQTRCDNPSMSCGNVDNSGEYGTNVSGGNDAGLDDNYSWGDNIGIFGYPDYTILSDVDTAEATIELDGSEIYSDPNFPAWINDKNFPDFRQPSNRLWGWDFVEYYNQLGLSRFYVLCNDLIKTSGVVNRYASYNPYEDEIAHETEAVGFV